MSSIRCLCRLWNSTLTFVFLPREFLLHYFALVLTKIYNVVVIFPRWALMIISGVFCNFIMKMLHSKATKNEEAAAKKKAEEAAAAADESTVVSADAKATGTSAAKGKAKQRKASKK